MTTHTPNKESVRERFEKEFRRGTDLHFSGTTVLAFVQEEIARAESEVWKNAGEMALEAQKTVTKKEYVEVLGKKVKVDRIQATLATSYYNQACVYLASLFTSKLSTPKDE